MYIDKSEQIQTNNNNILQYRKIQKNVNRLKIIQLGITFTGPDGKRPDGPCTWQFNFKFDQDRDEKNDESLNMLKKCGVDFDQLSKIGIDPYDFCDYLTSSGLVMCKNVTWVTFSAGYDFSYLMKYLTGEDLPDSEQDFEKKLLVFFPRILDMKLVAKAQSSLVKLGENLGAKRIGTKHQAGSDSLLTIDCYWRYCASYREQYKERVFLNKIAGLGMDLGDMEPYHSLYPPNHPYHVSPTEMSQMQSTCLFIPPSQHPSSISPSQLINHNSSPTPFSTSSSYQAISLGLGSSQLTFSSMGVQPMPSLSQSISSSPTPSLSSHQSSNHSVQSASLAQSSPSINPTSLSSLSSPFAIKPNPSGPSQSSTFDQISIPSVTDTYSYSDSVHYLDNDNDYDNYNTNQFTNVRRSNHLGMNVGGNGGGGGLNGMMNGGGNGGGGNVLGSNQGGGGGGGSSRLSVQLGTNGPSSASGISPSSSPVNGGLSMNDNNINSSGMNAGSMNAPMFVPMPRSDSSLFTSNIEQMPYSFGPSSSLSGGVIPSAVSSQNRHQQSMMSDHALQSFAAMSSPQMVMLQQPYGAIPASRHSTHHGSSHPNIQNGGMMGGGNTFNQGPTTQQSFDFQIPYNTFSNSLI